MLLLQRSSVSLPEASSQVKLVPLCVEWASSRTVTMNTSRAEGTFVLTVDCNAKYRSQCASSHLEELLFAVETQSTALRCSHQRLRRVQRVLYQKDFRGNASIHTHKGRLTWRRHLFPPLVLGSGRESRRVCGPDICTGCPGSSSPSLMCKPETPRLKRLSRIFSTTAFLHTGPAITLTPQW